MAGKGGVSRRAQEIYQLFYAEREALRFENFARIFDTLADHVEDAQMGAKIELDYFRLAELIRSYFLDVIRYKEYHFDPPEDSKVLAAAYPDLSEEDRLKTDPMAPAWLEAVHSEKNLNASKVAAYTVKWILKNKPISVISTRDDIGKLSAEPDAVPSFLAAINEQFALHCAFFALDIDPAKVSPKIAAELIYCFRFRPFDETSYFLILSKQCLTASYGAD